MKKYFIITLFIYNTIASIGFLDYNLVHFVDKLENNNNVFIFRGNQPENKSFEFAIDELREYLFKRAKEEGNFILPSDYYLIDISFLLHENPEEKDAFEIEKEFFEKNKNLGKFISWPLKGDRRAPHDFPKKIMIQFAKKLPEWQIDHLQKRIIEMRTLLCNHKEKKTCVIYFHCGHGQDRTGEFAGAYSMQYLNQSFQQVWDFNSKLGMDVPENINSMEWYCEYLKYSFQYNLDCSSIFFYLL